MHHIHIGAISITKPAKQSYVILTSELKMRKTLSSGPNFVNLNFAKTEFCSEPSLTFSVDTNRYKVRLNPSSYAKVMTILL